MRFFLMGPSPRGIFGRLSPYNDANSTTYSAAGQGLLLNFL